MTNLSVNLNKVALLRNQRDTGYPDLTEHAELILKAGAQGLTIHPRPDERHIRKTDVGMISEFIIGWNEDNNATIELNIEGYPSQDFIDLVTTIPCTQVTLVPDAPDQKTSDHGWDLGTQKPFLTDIVAQLNEAQRRVSLFIDPDPSAPAKAAALGADRVELYTGPYAFAWEADNFGGILTDYAETMHEATEAGIAVNAGHDLNLSNLRTFLDYIPDCAEVSIGHAITDDALKMGWSEAVKAYLNIIADSQKQRRSA